MNACGLDFGTSNSGLSWPGDGAVRLIELEDGATSIPSAILFSQDDDLSHEPRNVIDLAAIERDLVVAASRAERVELLQHLLARLATVANATIASAGLGPSDIATLLQRRIERHARIARCVRRGASGQPDRRRWPVRQRRQRPRHRTGTPFRLMRPCRLGDESPAAGAFAPAAGSRSDGGGSAAALEREQRNCKRACVPRATSSGWRSRLCATRNLHRPFGQWNASAGAWRRIASVGFPRHPKDSITS